MPMSSSIVEIMFPSGHVGLKREVRVMHEWSPPQVRDFSHLHLRDSTQKYASASVYNTVHIFVLFSLKNNHMKELRNLHFFLGPTCMVANKNRYCFS